MILTKNRFNSEEGTAQQQNLRNCLFSSFIIPDEHLFKQLKLKSIM